MASVGYMYSSSIRTHLIIMVITVFLCTLLAQINYGTKDNFPFFIIASSVIGILTYFSPLTFAKRDDSLLRQLPAKPIEKWAFYMIYCLVFAPIIIEGLWFGLNGIFKIFGYGFSCDEVYEIVGMMTESNKILETIYPDRNLYMTLGAIQSAFYIIMCLYIVLRAKSHRTLKTLLVFFGFIFAIGFLSGIAGFIVALTQSLASTNPESLATAIIDRMQILIIISYSISVFAGAILAYLSYGVLKKGQVKN